MDNKAQQLTDKIFNSMMQKGLVPIEISARHVHLSQQDVEKLFGSGHQLTPIRPLSQPGQSLCKERVTLVGPKGSIANVAVLGPARGKTQVEITYGDSRKLGVVAPVRISGELDSTPGITITAGEQSVSIAQGVVIAKRHIHMLPEDARRLSVKDKDLVNVQVLSDRPLIFEDTEVRVSKDFSFNMHIDTEEAAAAGIGKAGYGLIKILPQKEDRRS